VWCAFALGGGKLQRAENMAFLDVATCQLSDKDYAFGGLHTGNVRRFPTSYLDACADLNSYSYLFLICYDRCLLGEQRARER
jgi:hypothetical protein